MVRARLRADQMRDVDNLTEPEHDALVHENLVVSGTLTLSGTQGAIDLTTDGTDLLVDGAAISGTGGGASTLLELTDTPTAYDDGKYLKSTAAGAEWATVSGAGGGLSDLDGGSASTVYTSAQAIDGGNASS